MIDKECPKGGEHEYRLVGLGSCWRCRKCGKWE